MATLAEKREARRTSIFTAARLWGAAFLVLASHLILGEMGVSLVRRLVLLFGFVVLCIAGAEAFVERERRDRT